MFRLGITFIFILWIKKNSLSEKVINKVIHKMWITRLV
jgi:hypothetical protein